MRLITVAGPPSSGKTSVLLKTFEAVMAEGVKAGVIKFDCLVTDDDAIYHQAGIPVQKGFPACSARTTISCPISTGSWSGRASGS